MLYPRAVDFSGKCLFHYACENTYSSSIALWMIDNGFTDQVTHITKQKETFLSFLPRSSHTAGPIIKKVTF